nr:DUF3784 domain-containing protein [Lachnospiraceae bacterium]
MIVGAVIDLAVGLLCIIMGLLLWRKQKVSLLHDYHYKNVREEDIPTYSRQIGIGLTVIGAGVFLSGVLNLFCPAYWWIPLAAGFAAGAVILYRAQKKYNGSVLG